MAYLPELHYCWFCGVYLGMDDGDGICWECDSLMDEEGNPIDEEAAKGLKEKFERKPVRMA